VLFNDLYFGNLQCFEEKQFLNACSKLSCTFARARLSTSLRKGKSVLYMAGVCLPKDFVAL
ncbi:hypothetical protein, partial [Howardella ureilytica]